MKTPLLLGAFLALCSCTALAQKNVMEVGGVLDIPLHSQDQDELKALEGPQELIKGEYVIWKYPFRWSATSEDGQTIALVPASQNAGAGQLLCRFVEKIATGYRVDINGKIYTIATPPGGQDGTFFRLAEIKLVGVTADIVKNRIGPPNKVLKNGKGVVFLYTKSITVQQQGADTISSTTRVQGSVGSDGFSGVGTTTTSVPYTEKMTYSPYAFKIFFNADGVVDHIEDLDTDSADWQRQ